jgi:hypothetical protein
MSCIALMKGWNDPFNDVENSRCSTLSPLLNAQIKGKESEKATFRQIVIGCESKYTLTHIDVQENEPTQIHKIVQSHRDLKAKKE